VTSILVLRGGALGDFLLTLPALHVLRRRWPDARVELVGNRSAAELAVRSGLLTAAHSRDEARWAGLYANGALPPDLRRFLASFDLVTSYLPDPERELHRVLPCRTGQRYLAFDATPTGLPAWRHLAEPLARELGFARLPDPPQPSLAVSPGPGPDGRIALHPGSGSPRKNWPNERWERLVDALAPRPVLVVLGEAEAALAPRWHARADGRVTIADRWTLPLLAETLAGCRRLIGHDTGISHLAAAVGTPCLLLFGPTDPAVWAPPGSGCVVLRRGSEISALSVEEVLAAATAAP
jgi:heptosyltransferase-2